MLYAVSVFGSGFLLICIRSFKHFVSKWSNKKTAMLLNSEFETLILNGFLACNSIKHDALTLMLKGLFVCRINRLFLSLIDVRILVLLTLLSFSKTICSLIGRVDAVGNCKFKDFTIIRFNHEFLYIWTEPSYLTYWLYYHHPKIVKKMSQKLSKRLSQILSQKLSWRLSWKLFQKIDIIIIIQNYMLIDWPRWCCRKL